MQLGLILLILAAPLLELALLIKLGQEIGFWPVMGIIVGTGLAGAALLRWQGLSMLRRMMDRQDTNSAAIEPIIAGGLLVVAAILLILPGPMTDVLGMVLALPPVRQLLARRMGRKAMVFRKVDIRGFRRGPRTGPGDPPSTPSIGPVIDGEFERIDDKTKTADTDRQPKT